MDRAVMSDDNEKGYGRCQTHYDQMLAEQEPKLVCGWCKGNRDGSSGKKVELYNVKPEVGPAERLPLCQTCVDTAVDCVFTPIEPVELVCTTPHEHEGEVKMYTAVGTSMGVLWNGEARPRCEKAMAAHPSVTYTLVKTEAPEVKKPLTPADPEYFTTWTKENGWEAGADSIKAPEVKAKVYCLDEDGKLASVDPNAAMKESDILPVPTSWAELCLGKSKTSSEYMTDGAVLTRAWNRTNHIPRISDAVLGIGFNPYIPKGE